MSAFSINKKSSYTVHPGPYAQDVPGSKDFPVNAFRASFVLVPLAVTLLTGVGLNLYWYSFFFALCALPTYMVFMVTNSYWQDLAFGSTAKHAGLKLTDFMEFTDASLKKKFESKQRIPMETFFEAYFDKKINIKGDMLDLLENRFNWASFRLTMGHVKFLINNFLPEMSIHSRQQDETQVREHYDRGNDFYAAFLGPRMIYTSGIITKPDERETLEELQDNKMRLVCEKMQLKKGEKHLDIGCGWGTLLAYAAKEYGVESTGVTLAREQTEFGLQRAKEWGVEKNVNILCHDYRDIPRSDAPGGIKYNKITCLEMAEHVGVFNFNKFLLQVSELLEDDGLFYMQVAGLRRPWQYEDLIWGLFMNKYIFPGADASTPLFFYINQLEYAGFEVVSVDTVGVHYSATLERWYQNWMSDESKQLIISKYGERWWRVWEFFLAYSSVIARQGSATCFQIVAHKNSNKFKRDSLISGYQRERLDAKKH